MKAAILAGGMGTRLAPYTTFIPKPLMPLGNRPILEIIISQLRQHGFTDVTLAVGYLSHLLRAYFEDGCRFGVHIDYSFEELPLGTAGPLTLLPNLNEPLLVMNGDVLTDLDYYDLYRYHIENEAAVTVALHATEVKIDLGVLKLDARSEVMEYIEKPTYSYNVSMGVYIVQPEVVARLPKGQRIDFPDMVHMLLSEGQRVLGYHFDGQWLDIGRPDDYARAVTLIEKLGMTTPEVTSYKQPAIRPQKPVVAAYGSNGR